MAARLLVLLAILGAVLALPSAASAQATRTWVSGVGDDANPCSRTAPCKTFAGSISKTAEGGEINALDPGGFGGVTITKAITIRSVETAGVLVSGTNGIVINAGPEDAVSLEGLTINGIGTGAQTSLSGVKVLAAGSVRIHDTSIQRFKAGIAFVPATRGTRLVVSDSEVFDNGIGVFAGPATNADPASAGSGQVLLDGARVELNRCGVVVTSRGAGASTPDAAAGCGVGAGPPSQPARLSVVDSSISHNRDVGLLAHGTDTIATIARDVITGNGLGLSALDGGTVLSLGANEVHGNATDGAPTQARDLHVGPAGPAASRSSRASRCGCASRGGPGP